MSSNESSSSPHYNSTTRSYFSPSSTSPPPPPSPNSVTQDGTESQDRTQKPAHKLNLKLKKSSGNIASFLCSSKETGLLKELSKKLPPQTETAISNHSAPVGPISEERPRPKTAGIRKAPLFPPPRKANSMDQIATAMQEHSPNMTSESSYLSEHFDAMAHISPNHVSQPSSSSTSSSHTDILFGDSESVSQTDDPLTMKTPSNANDGSLEVSKLTTREPVTPAITSNEGISMKKPLPPRPQPVGRSPSNSSSEELRQERFDSKHPLDTASMSKPVPKPRLRLQKASTVPDVAADTDDTDSLQDQPHSAGANIQHSESHLESGMETIKEPVVGELKYENEVLKHQIFHLKDQRSRLADENQTLREEITQLQGSGEFGSPKPTPPPRKSRSPSLQTQTPLTKSSPTHCDQTQTKMPSESTDVNSVMDKPVSRRPPPSPPLPYRPSTSAPSLPPVKPARLPRQRSIPKLSSSEPPDSPISEIPPPTTKTTTTQTTTSPQTSTNGSPTPKPKVVHHQEGSRVAEDGSGRISPQKPKPTATSKPIPIPRGFSRSSSVPARQEVHAEEVTVDDELCERPAGEVKVPVHPIAPPQVRLGAVYKKVAIKPDESWIKRKRLDSDEDGGVHDEHSQLVVQSPRRPNMPYRSHPILPPSTSPTPPSRFSPALPRSSDQQPARNVPSENSETSITAALDLKQIRPQRHPERRQADIQRRRHSSIVKSNSDDSVSGSLQRETESDLRTKQTGTELRQNGNDFKVIPPKKPPRLRAKQQGPPLEDPNFRPISMIADINPPEASFQEKEFGVSCTLPHGIQPEKALHKSLRMKRQPKTSSPAMEGNGKVQKHKSKGFLGRFKSKTQYAKPEAPPLEEEGEEDGSDSDDQKGGTIKSMPMLRRVSRVKSFRASAIEEESEPEYHQLFEYAFVVGLKEDPTTGKLVTEMKYTFPPASGLVFSGKDAALKSIPQFCFPDIDRWKPTVTYSSETFSFVLTDIEGSKRFGYCRRLLPAGSGPRLPEVYCIVSPLGCFSLYAKILDHMEERRMVSSSAVFAFLKAIVANPFPRPVKGSDMETVVFTRPMDSRLEHVDFSMLFSTLSCRKIIQLFSSMLMERRIILCAHSLSLLTGCAHALLALLYPFDWQHVFIPVLPTSLIDFVCSPLPYIIGINPSCIKQLDELEMEEAVVIDLEKKKFVRKIGDEASILPSKLFQYLEHSLSSSVISSEYQKSPSRRPQRSRADEIVVNTFMTFFVYLYGDYKRYIKRTLDPATGMMEFQKKDFVKKFSSKSTRRFLEAFHMTQMFENFIEERENPAKAETAAQSLFDKTKISELRERCREIEIFSSKSKFDRWKIRKGLKK